MSIILNQRLDIAQNTILGRKTAGTGNWEVLTAAEVAAIVTPQFRAVSGSILTSATENGTLGTTVGAIAVNTLHAFPWDFWTPTSITGLRSIITTAGAAGNAYRLAFYDTNSLGYPGNKLTATEFLGNGTITTVQVSAFAPVMLWGRYWMVINANAPLATRTQPVGSSPTLGVLATLPTGGLLSAYQFTQPFNTLPATFPAGATAVGRLVPVIGAVVG